jgi:serine/threonine protein kinase
MAAVSTTLGEGKVIGEWKIAKLLGSGGQGTVYAVRAVREKHVPPRALKISFAPDDKSRARFEREIILLQTCASPHVLSIVEANPTWEERIAGLPPFAYYVAERCSGALNDPKLELGDARRRLALFREACAGVAYLNALSDPVIHRDIKPSNFLLAEEPRRVLIADFGIAKNELAPSDLTATQEIVGTQHYRAPEVLNGGAGNVQSDVYSLGRVLEWLMTGDISTDLGARSVPRGGDLDDDACDAIDRVIAKATQAVPLHRFSSVREIVDQLPDLWISIRPRPTMQVALAAFDAAVVWPAALSLARTNDHVGWWQLEQQLRRAYPDQLKQWRAELDHGPRITKRSELPPIADRLMSAVGGRIMFGLAGVVSQQVGVLDQTRMIDDLLTVPDWPTGPEFAFEAPRGLVYIFQHLHGALCCERNRIDLALQFAATSVASARSDRRSPLWRTHDLTGWPKLLGGACTDAWRYLIGLRGRFAPLAEVFALQTDFDVGLASYSMLLGLVEFAHDSKSLARKSEEEWRTLRLSLDVPPMFIELDRETVRTAARRIIENAEVVRSVAERANVEHSLMRDLWRRWLVVVQRYYVEINPSHFGDPWPEGDLA